MKLHHSFLILFVIAALLRLLLIQNNSFPFTMDQGRDMVDIRRIVIDYDPLLIGQVTSMPGLFHGPFWYYFNIIPFIVGGGNPSYLVYWTAIWHLIAVYLIWHILQNKNRTFAFIASLLFLFHPILLYTSRYSFNPNLMPVAAVFTLLLLESFNNNQTKQKAFLLGLLSGIALQLEVGFGVLYFPFLLLVMAYLKSNFKMFATALVGFGITLIPQFVFELRHGFLMTNSFMYEMFGEGESLGNNLSMRERFTSHLDSYIYVIGNSLKLPAFINCLIFIFSLLVLFKRPVSKYFVFSVVFLIFSFVAYMLYPFRLNGWFLNSLFVFVLFIFALFFTQLLKTGDYLIKFIALIILTVALVNSFSFHWKYALNEKEFSNDPSVLRNELAAIDWVYQQADGEPFKVFNYMPSVIDYPYQYLFWWHGENEYGYHPDTVAYLEDVPTYIENNDHHFDKRKQVAEDYSTFLIIEPDSEKPERQSAWLNNFESLCTKEEKKFAWGTVVQERVECLPTPSATTTETSS